MKFTWPLCLTYGLRRRNRFVLRFYRPLYSSYALRGPYLSLFEERYGRKTNQGGCGPHWIPGVMFWRKPDVLCAYHLAMVRVTRLSRLRRCRLSPCLCVLRCQGHGNAYDFTGHRSTHESVETVCLHTPRTGLNRVNCTRANTYRVGTSPLRTPV